MDDGPFMVILSLGIIGVFGLIVLITGVLAGVIRLLKK